MSVTINHQTNHITATNGSVTTDGRTGSNLIINGAMQVAQRGTSNSSVSDGAFVIDRYSLRTSNNGWYAAEQSSDAPVGFSHSLKVTSNGANTPASGAYIFFTQKIEGFNSAQLEFGTANAKTITISFYIKSSLTGTFAGAIRNSAQNRSYPYTFTISSANTWEYKTVTVTGDTTGTWVGSTNGIGLDMIFNLGSGSSNSGTAGVWAGAGYLNATGAVNLVETSGATLFMTGLQLEVGDTATPFEHRSYGDELARCQRYYFSSDEADSFISAFDVTSGNTYYFTIINPVTMRSSPTITLSNESNSSFDNITVFRNYATRWGGYDVATASGRGYFQFEYVADAEL